jgi:subtilase family serine protease
LFNKNFGLPECSVLTIAPGAARPLAAASAKEGCQLAVVYSNSAGAMIAGAPSYDEQWATEIAVDVQWAHATAPMARIVLIEAPDSKVGSIVGAVSLANAMGSGVVSMSLSAPEGAWSKGVDAAFAIAGMGYVAATGDSGAGVFWPSSSSRVLAVGGTSLEWDGSGGARAESAWEKTGGGASSFIGAPSYQGPAVPGMGSRSGRSAADVSMNADPYRGQYVATMAPGATSAGWVSAGGTSIGAPEWAGIVAISNAQRALSGKPAHGAPHESLYAVSTNSAIYGTSFMDVVLGANGPCALCSAAAGYDAPTGLGTPNAADLLSRIVGFAYAPRSLGSCKL